MKFTINRFLTTAAMLTLVAVACSGCKKSAVDPFPSTGSVAGWEKSGETRTFAAKDLYQYIDGDAEQYVAAGVVTASTADYKFQGGLEATADVYTMGDAGGSGKIFAKELTSDGKTVALGDGGVSHSGSVVFHKGTYLVRIVAYQLKPGSQEALLLLARAIEAKL